jgi:hypothetical protein
VVPSTLNLKINFSKVQDWMHKRNARGDIIGPGLAIALIGLIIFFVPEFFIFKDIIGAGIFSVGITIIAEELVAAKERNEHKIEEKRLNDAIQELTRSLNEKISELNHLMHKEKDRLIKTALTLGYDCCFESKLDPIRYQALGQGLEKYFSKFNSSDHDNPLKRELNINPLLDLLKEKHEPEVIEAFHLGHQLARLRRYGKSDKEGKISNSELSVVKETNTGITNYLTILERLKMICAEKEVQEAFVKFWPKFTDCNDKETFSLSAFFEALFIYLTLPPCEIKNEIKNFLIGAFDCNPHVFLSCLSKILDADTEKRRQVLVDALKFIKSLGVEDPDVDGFLGTLVSDFELIDSAKQRGFNPFIGDADVVYKHYQLLKDKNPDLLKRFEQVIAETSLPTVQNRKVEWLKHIIASL